MNNRQHLENLSDEELASSPYFCSCPYGEIYRKSQAAKGNAFCERDKIIEHCGKYTLDVHKQVKEVCTKCKVNWLNSEYKKDDSITV